MSQLRSQVSHKAYPRYAEGRGGMSSEVMAGAEVNVADIA
jgi:hypothetical protein